MENENEFNDLNRSTVSLYQKIMKHADENRYTFKDLCEHIINTRPGMEVYTFIQLSGLSPDGNYYYVAFMYAFACSQYGLPDGKKVTEL